MDGVLGKESPSSARRGGGGRGGEGGGVVVLSPTFPRQGKSACSSKISGGMYCEAEWVSGHPGAGAGIEGALSFHF